MKKIKDGEALRRTRKAKNMSQDELADLAGCAQAAISNYERGVRTIPKPLAEKFAEVLA